MTGTRYSERPNISIAYLSLMAEILAERGIASERLLDGLPIDPALLDRPNARMSATQWTRVVLRALELTSDETLGYEYGLRMRPSVHGILGYAAMSSATMRDAIAVMLRYTSVRQAHFRLELETDDDHCLVILRERFPIPVARSFFHENILVGLASGIPLMVGRTLDELPEMALWFDVPEPAYYERYRARLPRCRHGAPVSALAFPPSYLALRPVLADPHASKEAIALCERELSLAPDSGGEIAVRVVAELESAPIVGSPSLEDVASRLGTSTRTLKRHLARSSTSFLALKIEVRKRAAQQLLSNSSLTVREIAERLGYENPANFSRAFVEWTGDAPTRYRARARGPA